MKKIDAVVIRETVYVAVFTALFSVIMEAVFLVLGKWDITVLLGNLLGAGAAVLNFLLMGITVQCAVSKDEKDAKNLVRLSQTLRNFMLIAAAAIGFLLGCFNAVSVIVPFIFPSFAVKIRMLACKETDKGGEKSE